MASSFYDYTGADLEEMPRPADVKKPTKAQPSDLELAIDPDKAVALVRRLRCQLRFVPIEHHDPLYGDQPPHRWYPSGLLVNAEDVIACGSQSAEHLALRKLYDAIRYMEKHEGAFRCCNQYNDIRPEVHEEGCPRIMAQNALGIR
jgi:hypothetical protein